MRLSKSKISFRQYERAFDLEIIYYFRARHLKRLSRPQFYRRVFDASELDKAEEDATESGFLQDSDRS